MSNTTCKYGFTVGDRVYCNGKTQDGIYVKGKEGIVIGFNIHPDYPPVAVCWDNHFNGHACFGLCPDKHGWCVQPEDLEILCPIVFESDNHIVVPCDLL